MRLNNESFADPIRTFVVDAVYDTVETEPITDGNDLSNETGAGDLINVSDVVDLSNASDARASIMIIDEALATLNHYRSNLGAISNRLDHVVANNTNITINLTASVGRIQDADYAAESARLVKSQLIQQSSVAMIAQANTSKEDVLQLIEGD